MKTFREWAILLVGTFGLWLMFGWFGVGLALVFTTCAICVGDAKQ